MKKIPLGTKIIVITAGLVAVAGIFYAANPSPFAIVNTPIGVAASKTELIASEYCSQKIDRIDCLGNVSVLAQLPPGAGCGEKYMTIAPAQSANAGFTPRDIFITRGTKLFKLSAGSVTTFATLSSCGDDHTGITFDHEGTFGFNLIVTCENGIVWQVDNLPVPPNPPHVTLIARTGTLLEGPAVVPLSFGPLGGQILAADENNGAIHAIDNTGNVTYDVFDWSGAESVIVIPPVLCSFRPSPACPSPAGAFFQSIDKFNAIYHYPPAVFNWLGG